MNRKFVLKALILMPLLVVIFAVPTRTSLQTTVYVAPSTIAATVGQTFFVNINISDVVDLYGWEFKLKWNSTVLDVINVTEGDFLKSIGDTLFWPIINNTQGCILVDCTLWGNILGVNGSGTLAIVEFKAENAGESILDLCDTKLVSSLVQPIAHQSMDGYGYFSNILPGDADFNGLVEMPDFYIWRESFGVSKWPEDVDPDFNDDGIVDMYDFYIWREHFGESI